MLDYRLRVELEVEVTGTATEEEVAALVQRVTRAARALISGDLRGYVDLIHHADDYTLMSPYGGEPVHRHADALVHAIDHERLGQLARG